MKIGVLYTVYHKQLISDHICYHPAPYDITVHVFSEIGKDYRYMIFQGVGEVVLWVGILSL